MMNEIYVQNLCEFDQKISLTIVLKTSYLSYTDLMPPCVEIARPAQLQQHDQAARLLPTLWSQHLSLDSEKSHR